MGDRTAIEWSDATWNPVTGCTKVSPGCKFCYAERVATRYWGARKFTDIRFHADRLDQPLRWRRPRRVFVNSMSDLFHEAVPDNVIAKVCGVMQAARRHTFQVLTKRPQRMHDWMRWIAGAADGPVTRCWLEMQDTIGLLNIPENSVIEDDDDGPPNPWPLPNVWLGVSVENQTRADERIPWLLQTPAAVRFLSVEPLLEPVDLRHHLRVLDPPFISWVIVGGESGGTPDRSLLLAGPDHEPSPHALTWVRSLRDQCVAAGVPFFFKQWGGPTPKSGGRLLDGREWDEYPTP